MGRRKLPMEYMKNERARNTTFEKRKNGLKKKAHELATLCDVPLCMIIYQAPNSDPDTVPANREEALSIINRYTNKKMKGADHPQQLSSKLQYNNIVNGSWLPVLDACTKEELSGLANILHDKMQAVEKRIGILRETFNTTNVNTNSGGFASYHPNLFMDGPEFYHPHGHGQGGGGGVGGSGIIDAYCTESDHEMQMGGHVYWYSNCQP